MEELEILRSFIKGIPAVTELVQNAQSAVDAERDELVTALTAETRCAISEADLKAMQLSALRGLSRSFLSVDYSGRGGPSGNALGADAEDEGFAPAPSVVLAPIDA